MARANRAASSEKVPSADGCMFANTFRTTKKTLGVAVVPQVVNFCRWRYSHCWASNMQ